MTDSKSSTNRRCRIVLTGGPGGGKTTAADLFRRELGARVVVVPEAATLLFSGGFPRSTEIHARHSAQCAIYHVQRNLEDVQSALYPERILLCDRGTIDGAAYWPDEEQTFFDAVGSTEQAELDRYDEVIFFESAAVGGISIEGGNPTRIESNNTTASQEQSGKRSARSAARMMADWAAREPGGKHACDGDANGDEAVWEVALRPRRGSTGLKPTWRPRGENAARVRRR